MVLCYTRNHLSIGRKGGDAMSHKEEAQKDSIGQSRVSERSIPSILPETEPSIDGYDIQDTESSDKSLMELIREGYFEADEFDRFTVISPYAARILGYKSPHEVLGMKMSRFWATPDQRDRFLTGLSEKGRVETYEASLLRKDGTRAKVELDARLMYDDDGLIVGKRGTFRNVVVGRNYLHEQGKAYANEQIYSLIVEKGNDGIVVVKDLDIVFMNNKICEMTGYTLEDLEAEREREGSVRGLLMSAMRASGPEVIQESLSKYESRMAGIDVSRISELRIFRKDGTVLPVELSSSAIEYEGGPADLIIIRDISARYEAEAARLEAEDRYKAIFNNPLQAVFINDIEGHFIEVNEYFQELSGFSSEEMRGLNYNNIIHPDDVTKVFEYLASVAAGGNMAPIEVRCIHKSDEVVWISTLVLPIKRDGEVHTVLGFAQDICERKQAEESLRCSEERLKELVEKLRLSQEDLSTPVVQVWDRVLALPLIGVIDGTRASRIIDVLLPKIVETRALVVVLDVTGVASVDTETGNHLMRTVQSCRLIGTECVVTGITPEVAQSIVHLGMDMHDLVTMRDLHEGIEWALDYMRT